MTLSEVIEKLGLEILSGRERLGEEVSGGYTSDLLSDVIANARERNVWITLQTHQNIIAVAKLRDLAGIILVNSRTPDDETLKKAAEEEIPLLGSSQPAFVISGRLHRLLFPSD